LKVKDAIRFIIDSSGDIYSPWEIESIAFVILDFIGFPRKEIFRKSEDIIPEAKVEFIRKVVKELKTFRPVQYILGETEFYGLKFKVDEHVLIPRQETEELIMRILKDNKLTNPKILDLGTGSGCIAVSLAKNIPNASVYATDISTSALKIAVKNAKLNEVVVNAIPDNMLDSKLEENLKFDIIVSNPPYVLDAEKELMHNNVLKYEPETALFVRNDNPLEFYKAIAQIALKKLLAGGSVYVEINENFGHEVAELFSSAGLVNAEIILDIHDKNRFVKAQKK
jgi:release factor glutamine methyltransferase